MYNFHFIIHNNKNLTATTTTTKTTDDLLVLRFKCFLKRFELKMIQGIYCFQCFIVFPFDRVEI
jgi:hypothetical protein